MTEIQVRLKIADIVLSVVNNPKYPDRKARICKYYHISKRMLTREKLLDMKGSTYFLLMIAIAQIASYEEFEDMLARQRELTLSIAEMEDGTPEAIIKAHEGSRIGVKKSKHNKKEGQK